jgi:hypothetical protein
MMRCPNCELDVPFTLRVFPGTRCRRCNAKLLVSATYCRVLITLSLIAAWALLWFADVRKLLYPRLGVPFGSLASLWLGFPVAFVILFALVRIAPHIVTPKLVHRRWGAVTTLDLNSEPAEGKKIEPPAS